MEPECSLPHSQVPATCPYPEPDQSSPCSPTHFLNTHFNTILPSTPRVLQAVCPTRFPTKVLYAPPLFPIRATCFANLILLNLITRMIFCEEYRSLNSTLCNFPHSLVTSSPLGPNILLSTLLSNTLSLRSSLNVSDQVSHPYKTTGKITVLYILNFMYLDSKL